MPWQRGLHRRADEQFDFFGFGGALAAWIIEEYPETWPVHVRDALWIAHRVTRRLDTVVRGRRTYQPALDAGIARPYPHLRQVVFSTTLLCCRPCRGDGVAVPLVRLRELKNIDCTAI